MKTKTTRRSFFSKLGLAIGAAGVAAKGHGEEKKKNQGSNEPEYVYWKNTDGTTGGMPVWK